MQKSGVNLGALYAPTRAIAENPSFSRQDVQEAPLQQSDDAIHVALVSIRTPEDIDDQTLSGIALTLSQLVRLDMQIVLVFECEHGISRDTTAREVRTVYQTQGQRLVRALEEHNNAGARYVDGALGVDRDSFDDHAASKLHGPVSVAVPELIIAALKRTAIPVVPALAYTSECQIFPVSRAGVMLALTVSLAGLSPVTPSDGSVTDGDHQSEDTTLDRIIMIDSCGGVPASHRADGAHVFVNLEQEYSNISEELQASTRIGGDQRHAIESASTATQQLANLDTLRSCLGVLSPACSALLISPQEAASSSQSSAQVHDTIGIGTRRQKNPLIHNLLTNKPVISSSLPVARLSATDSDPTLPSSDQPVRSTLIKRGMPVKIVPDPRTHPWTPPASLDSPTISLEAHPDINFARLLALIEDSFRRPLDVQHYLDRIRNRIAGVIIAGEYEGGAILTWEEPPPRPASSQAFNPDVAARQPPKRRLVPYLDKFAVASRSQGSSGVADMVCLLYTSPSPRD